MNYRFVIAIIHRNGESLILRCLEALHTATTDRDQVVVVDNGSEDQSVARIRERFPEVEVIENGCNNGFAAANNQVLTRLDADYFLLLNNDVVVGVEMLQQLQRRFESQPEAAVISPQLIGKDGRPQRSHGVFMRPLDEVLSSRLRRRQPRLSDGSGAVEVDTVIGACMAVRGRAVAEVGVLDPAFFFYFEETEWCHRFAEAGYRVLLDREIEVVHERGTSTREVRNEAQIEMLNSRLLYYQKVFPPTVARLLSGYRVLRIVINLLFALLLVGLSLGVIRRPRLQLWRYGQQLLWLLLGRPRGWGLPDKCPPVKE